MSTTEPSPLTGNETSKDEHEDDFRLLFLEKCEDGDQKATWLGWIWVHDLCQRRIGLLYGVISAVTLSLQFIFVEVLLDKFSSDELMFSRSVFMFVIILRISWKRSLEYDLLDLLLYGLYGILNFGGIYLSYLALNFTTVGNVTAIAINLTIPTAIFANMFLGEPATLRKLVLFLINFIGIVLIANPSVIFFKDTTTMDDFYGCCLALVALISLTLSRIVARKSSLRGSMDASLMTLMTGVVGVPLCLFIVMFSSWSSPSSLADWIIIAAYVILSLLANQSAMAGVKTESASNISALTSLSVPLAYIVGFFYLGDKLKIVAIIGATLVLGSTFVSLKDT